MLITIILFSIFFINAFVFYIVVFIKKPHKLKKLNENIIATKNLYNELNNSTAKILSEYALMKQGYDELMTLVSELKSVSKNLSEKIEVQNIDVQQLIASKLEYQEEIKNLSIKLNELNANIDFLGKKHFILSSEIDELGNQKFILGLELGKLKAQIEPLQLQTQSLLERKSDLEQENSHLSKEIIKKKTSCNTDGSDLTKIVTYDVTPEITKPTKIIGYEPYNSYSSITYPSVFMPRPFSAIQFVRKGRLGQRGFTEPAFEEDLKTYFLRQRNLQLFSDRFLFVSNGTKPYEPDFTLIDESNNLNLFINIEIDEPYDGWSRCATHFIGRDDHRNQFFTDRGWVVIRFAEIQIHLNPKGCCRFVAEIIKSLNDNFIIPNDLLKTEPLIAEDYWTKVQCEKWQKVNYRENYLGIEGFSKKATIITDPSELVSNDNEKRFLKNNPTQEKESTVFGSINVQNIHQRDSRIQFLPKPHLYIIDNNPNTISVSTLVKSFFQDFDGDYWANRNAARDGVTPEYLLQKWEVNRQDAANQGTELHLNIEEFFQFNTVPENKVEFNHFLNLYNSQLKELKAYRTEWRVFDDILYIAGTIDMIFKKSDNTYVIYDWKRSKEIKQTNPYNNGFGPCSTLQDCNYNHYCLQINIYKRILEDYYAKPVSEMKMVQLHPNFDNYQIFDIPDMQNEINEIYEAII